MQLMEPVREVSMMKDDVAEMGEEDSARECGGNQSATGKVRSTKSRALWRQALVPELRGRTSTTPPSPTIYRPSFISIRQQCIRLLRTRISRRLSRRSLSWARSRDYAKTYPP